MKTILIPTDFSETANNAARYGVEFACNVHAEKIILYNAYSMPLATEMTWALLETDELKKASETALQQSRMVLLPFCPKEVVIETMADFGFFAQRINDVAADEKVDIIIMGITTEGGFSKVFFGNHALSTAQHIKMPLLIVPPGAAWQPIEKIAWACDFKNIGESTPLHILDNVLKITNAALHVIHNEDGYKEYHPEIIEGTNHLTSFFKNQKLEIAFLNGKNLHESVNEYVFEKGIDWLILVPHKHNWIFNLFSKSHTDELAFHTYIPVLCLHS